MNKIIRGIITIGTAVNPRVAELNENLVRLRSDVNALQKQVDGDIAAVPLELNEVMRVRRLLLLLSRVK
jgi:hypothetical protein